MFIVAVCAWWGAVVIWYVLTIALPSILGIQLIPFQIALAVIAFAFASSPTTSMSDRDAGAAAAMFFASQALAFALWSAVFGEQGLVGYLSNVVLAVLVVVLVVLASYLGFSDRISAASKPAKHFVSRQARRVKELFRPVQRQPQRLRLAAVRYFSLLPKPPPCPKLALTVGGGGHAQQGPGRLRRQESAGVDPENLTMQCTWEELAPVTTEKRRIVQFNIEHSQHDDVSSWAEGGVVVSASAARANSDVGTAQWRTVPVGSLLAGNIYRVRVRQRNSAGWSAWSEPSAQCATPPDTLIRSTESVDLCLYRMGQVPGAGLGQSSAPATGAAPAAAPKLELGPQSNWVELRECPPQPRRKQSESELSPCQLRKVAATKGAHGGGARTGAAGARTGAGGGAAAHAAAVAALASSPLHIHAGDTVQLTRAGKAAGGSLTSKYVTWTATKAGSEGPLSSHFVVRGPAGGRLRERERGVFWLESVRWPGYAISSSPGGRYATLARFNNSKVYRSTAAAVTSSSGSGGTPGGGAGGGGGGSSLLGALLQPLPRDALLFEVRKHVAASARSVARSASTRSILQAAPAALPPGGCDCAICMEPITKLAVTPCGHSFCKTCIKRWITTRPCCPMCTRALRIDEITRVYQFAQGTGAVAE
jgi:hypothetical protein